MNNLEVKNLSVETAEKRVVDNASLSLGAGEVHIVMGPNGSGKSSLANALMGHPRYTIAGGTIALNGEDITQASTEARAKKGLFLSMQYLPSVAGVTLLSFLHRAHKELTGEEVSIFEYHKQLEVRAKEIGIDPAFLRRGLNDGLSGGEKKQTEMLQLLALKPKFAILDEIDSGVDVDSLQKVFRGIELLRKEGTGFLLITHYQNILKNVEPDRVHVMKEGKVMRTGGKELAEEITERGFESLTA
ncbi:MAG: Fe-S cluster assembly ATPase SufC [Candidatus Yonathbacteria bacterium RIFOXYC1_FULL_52_10]|uniref:Fe-S cluster assembly ATPase SufC n=1 Tax=Candidatus Yonathbacteria bacterium RIFOXYD1_FULL_52_36 TaxID=1802730 RepID=A0A1G2SN70_9BACT|nr:MAG: Fe-S cluster assembly ATPase SufC [Candidatus Yonathbacteria bacterium RIFOXYC1_FULL_52_10]OHA86426.1 MAG: Fe-S cluster assembly ATPase SufC [Candidatus Yonathbacteria bacterium RIFOXYD1_FULL_52_36]